MNKSMLQAMRITIVKNSTPNFLVLTLGATKRAITGMMISKAIAQYPALCMTLPVSYSANARQAIKNKEMGRIITEGKSFLNQQPHLYVDSNRHSSYSY